MFALRVAIVLAFVLCSPVVLAVDSDGAMYVGGTLTTKVPEKTEGKLDLSQEAAARFIWKKGEALIPYDKDHVD